MGKRKQRKKRSMKAKKQGDPSEYLAPLQNQTTPLITPNINRRKFILAGLGLAAAGISAPYLITTSHSKEMPTPRQDPWDHLYGEYLIEYDFEKAMRAKVPIPLGTPTTMTSGNPIIDEVRRSIPPQVLKDTVKAVFGTQRPPLTFLVKEQHYAIPDSSDRSERLKDYAIHCISYIQHRLPTLPRLDLDWVVVDSQDDFSKGYDHKGFVFRQHLFVRSVYATPTPRDESSHRLLMDLTFNTDGGRAIHKGKESLGVTSRYLAICPGRGGINVPFSEYIPLALADYDFPFVLQSKDRTQYEQIMEAFQESIAYLLGQEMVDKLGIPHGKKRLDDDLQAVLSTGNYHYKYVRKAIDWALQNGIDNAVELYLESPYKFRDAIL